MWIIQVNYYQKLKKKTLIYDIFLLEKYNWDLFEELISRFPDSGLAKLGRGYKLNKQGEIDQAFDLFSVNIKHV